ncbi:hypothetical protein QQS21_005599 [Conoideocrella luteorostrata]|uniref:Uncharacterized protein n=1 Tax=Conoideocrella luteorostrata TaxID=1105319 RepID=A0AAJ0CP89_9HYPO|nr:hypothetical protein QQS21_005599 [Conoideocrella luteorostrata]
MPAPGPSNRSKGGNGGGNGAGKANILSFFKPVAQTQHAAPPTVSRHSQGPAEPPSSSPPPPSSPPEIPSTPPKPARTEIGASDDDGSLSDDSLEDLSCLLGLTTNAIPAKQGPQHNPYATPRAKRRATEFRPSPLAIMPKYKFDLKALAKDARCDDATMASSLHVKLAASAAKESNESNESAFKNPSTEETIAGIVKEKSGQDAQKVLRTVQRSDRSQSQFRCLFFEENYEAPAAPATPKLRSNSPWSLLTQGSAVAKEQHLASGLPQTILRKNGGLPDSIFEWMLDTLCIQTSPIVRQEYCNMITSCEEQIERLLTPERLQELFERLGARSTDGAGSGLSISKVDDEPYQGRDWSILQSFISLLGQIAGLLSVPAVEYATRTLVQLALDKFLICNVQVLSEYEFTIQQLANAIPGPSWGSFVRAPSLILPSLYSHCQLLTQQQCFEICSFLNSGIASRNIKTTALLCIPISTKRTHDLRRRIAVSILFQDDALACHNSEEVVTIRSIIDCLDHESFSIKSTTDFAELRASIVLLDVAIDDGSVIKFDNNRDEKKFNEDVDELAGRLREIWRKTNDAGMKLARTEAKSVVEWVQQRLSHSVRTRRQARKSVFDLPGQEDPFLPRQRDFMKIFLQKKPKSPAAAEEPEFEQPPPFDIDEDTIVVAGG